LKDFDRPLNKRGLRDAPLMGKKLHHYFPENLKVISSPAKRTKCASQFSPEPIFFPTCGCAGFSINAASVKENIFHLAEKIFYHYPKEM
jgi:phosphohistidine phosphatase